MRLYIGSDHKGYSVKEKLKASLSRQGHDVVDVGSYHMNKNDDYPGYAARIAWFVHTHNARGILVCGSGTGMAIAANKIEGIRAAAASDVRSATNAVVDNHANVLTLSGCALSLATLKRIVDAWISAKPSSAQRHVRRVKQIHAYERRELLPGVVVPSLLAHSYDEFMRQYTPLAFSPLLHVDVMDGSFVSDVTFDFKRALPQHDYEVHLMVQDPLPYLEKYTSTATILHCESKHLLRAIALLHKKKRVIGISLKPTTPLETLDAFLPLVDRVLVMTVHPGRYGAPVVPKTLETVKVLRHRHPHLDIQVDGHMNPKTIAQARRYGANMFVVGSYLQQAKDKRKALQRCYDVL